MNDRLIISDKGMRLQVLQVKLPDNQWACVYSRLDMPEHYTVDKRLDVLVSKFIAHRKGARA